MKFLVCEKQSGEGCGYMIGCGMVYNIVEADSREDLLDKLFNMESDEYRSLIGEQTRSEVLIIHAEHITTVNLKPLIVEHNKQLQSWEDKETVDKEKQQLKELQEKYEQNDI